MGQPFRFIHGHVRSPLKGPNRFKLRRGTVLIFLERRDGTVLECLISRKDFDRVRSHHWYANRNGKRTFYAAAWIDGAQVHMHKTSPAISRSLRSCCGRLSCEKNVRGRRFQTTEGRLWPMRFRITSKAPSPRGMRAKELGSGAGAGVMLPVPRQNSVLLRFQQDT